MEGILVYKKSMSWVAERGGRRAALREKARGIHPLLNHSPSSASQQRGRRINEWTVYIYRLNTSQCNKCCKITFRRKLIWVGVMLAVCELKNFILLSPGSLWWRFLGTAVHKSPVARSPWRLNSCAVASNICGVLSMELASCHSSSA